jgi:Icc-related predicted phosphoesterase
MIRVAAVGDLHYDRGSRNRMAPHLKPLGEAADLLLLAGDLTQRGDVAEAEALAEDLRGSPVPVVAVLGNHDYHGNQTAEIHAALRRAGILSLDGESVVLRIRGHTVGIMGVKGFGGGFGNACCAVFGEPEFKAFAQHVRSQAEILRRGLLELETDFRFALLHYSPVDETLFGEKREIYPFLGSYLLAQAIDEAGADAAFHGHAHFGVERGSTPGGIPVRNVAQNVIRHAYHVYSFNQARAAGEKWGYPAAAGDAKGESHGRLPGS